MRAALVTLTVCLLALPASAQYSGGSGTAEDPYQIATADDLIALGETPEDYDKHFIVTADIDLDPNLPGGKVFDNAVIAPDLDPTDWHFNGTYFTGNLDGQGHIIRDLVIDAPDQTFVGLFGTIHNGVVRNLGVERVRITGNDTVGALAAENYGGTVSCCYSTGTVDGDWTVGGLVGFNSWGLVANCYSSASVVGHANGSAGGLVGCSYARVVTCYSTGRVTGRGGAGGLVGYNEGSIYLSYWDTQSSGLRTSACARGKTTAQMKSMETFRGWGYDGQWNLDEGQDYPRLVWEGKPGVPVVDEPRTYGGGTGQPNDPYQIRTAEQLLAIGWYRDDFDKCFVLMADVDLAGVDANEVVPIGTADVPFTGVFDGADHAISHLAYPFAAERYVGLFGCIRGSYSLDNRWAVILNLHLVDVEIHGNESVGGLVGFNDHGIIRSCSTTGRVIGGSGTWEQAGGLVGSNSGLVVDCRSSADVDGGSDVGGLAGGNYGSIEDCDSSGRITAWHSVGGLVGGNSGSVSRCRSSSSITGKAGGLTCAGGLVGINGAWGADSSVADCYACGAVVGEQDDVGGLVGYNQGGRVTNCYSTSVVEGGGTKVGGLIGGHDKGVIANCFWDIETSGQATSAAGTGKTTAEMQTAGTFLDAGWDFADETPNGTEDIWWIDEGQSYPRLWWETLAGSRDGTVAVYRFWSPASDTYFYTADDAERRAILADPCDPWEYQGLAYYACADASEPGAAPVHRFYSDVVDRYFYTTSESEKNRLIQQYSDAWTYEGIAFYVFVQEPPPADTAPVYRFWSAVSSGYFYTIDEDEKARFIAEHAHVWTYEGIAWYAYKP